MNRVFLLKGVKSRRNRKKYLETSQLNFISEKLEVALKAKGEISANLKGNVRLQLTQLSRLLCQDLSSSSDTSPSSLDVSGLFDDGLDDCTKLLSTEENDRFIRNIILVIKRLLMKEDRDDYRAYYFIIICVACLIDADIYNKWFGGPNNMRSCYNIEYKLENMEGQEKLMEKLGVSTENSLQWHLLPKIKLDKTNNGSYCLTIKSDLVESSISFEPGKECKQTTLEGRYTTSVFSFKGSLLEELQSDEDGRTLQIERIFSLTGVKEITKFEGLEYLKTYVRVN